MSGFCGVGDQSLGEVYPQPLEMETSGRNPVYPNVEESFMLPKQRDSLQGPGHREGVRSCYE